MLMPEDFQDPKLWKEPTIEERITSLLILGYTPWYVASVLDVHISQVNTVLWTFKKP